MTTCTCSNCQGQEVSCSNSVDSGEVFANVLGTLIVLGSVGVSLFFLGRAILDDVKWSAETKARREMQEEIDAEKEKVEEARRRADEIRIAVEAALVDRGR